MAAGDHSTMIFHKTTTVTDIIHLRLSLPTRALPYLPHFVPGSNQMTFLVHDVETGARFNFECWIRDVGRHPKPIVSGGWRDYVREKGVLVGDDIVLSMIADQTGVGIQYNIAVIRRSIRLFGTNIPFPAV